MSRIDFKIKNKHGKIKNTGYMEIQNKSESNAELFIYGDILGDSYGDSYKQYYPDDKCPTDIKDFLEGIGDVETLDIHINSGGGSVFGGIAIYNQLKRKKCAKNVYVDGIAASIASVIACVGDKVIIPKNATFMMHKPSNGYFFTSMNADELRKDADTLDTCQKVILATYAEKANEDVSEETINNMINAETWLSGEEAAKYFDFEVEESVDAVACASDMFDMYKHTPDNFKQEAKTYTEEELQQKINDAVEAQKKTDALKLEILNGLSRYGR